MLIEYPDLSVTFVIRMLLSIFYFVSGTLKLFNMDGFGRTLQQYRLFPSIVCEVTAYLLPPAEIVISILLFTKSYYAVVVTSVFLLQLFLSLFTAFALYRRGHVKNCCLFGATINVKLSLAIVLLNLLLLAAARYLMIA